MVDPVLTAVRQYQGHARGNLSRKYEGNFHSGDVTLCSQLLSAAERLPRSRRWLVRRRLVRLFGAVTVEMCELYGDIANKGEAVLGILMNRRIDTRENPERFKPPDRGEYDRALRCDPDAKEVAALITSLRRLKKSLYGQAPRN